MKLKYLVFLAPALFSCSERWNDIAHKEVVAEILAFSVDDQIKSDIRSFDKTVSLTLPYDVDPAAVTVTEFSMTKGARCKPAIKVGDRIDVSAPLALTLTTYDKYTWTVTATVRPKPLSDIYNMGFDLWSKNFLDMDVPCGEDAESDQKEVWDSATTLFFFASGQPLVSKETEMVAAPGEGKAAVKLESLYSDPLSWFGNGTLFTGTLSSFDKEEFIANLGVPCKKRPLTLDGYARYIPKTIDHAKEPYADKMGTLDNAFVFVAFAEWSDRYEANPPAKILDDPESVPGIIGYGKLVFDKEMEDYEKFSIPIRYLNDKTPTHAVILASSSALGDYQTGAVGSTLYLDELGFSYE